LGGPFEVPLSNRSTSPIAILLPGSHECEDSGAHPLRKRTPRAGDDGTVASFALGKTKQRAKLSEQRVLSSALNV
jgi:hypothetical protein